MNDPEEDEVDEDEDEEYESEFADAIGLGRLLSAVDRQIWWCTSDDEEFPEDDEEYRKQFSAQMKVLEAANDTIFRLMDTLEEIHHCMITGDKESGWLDMVTEANVYAALGNAREVREMTKREILRAKRRMYWLWMFSRPGTKQEYRRATRYYVAFRKVILKELTRALTETYGDRGQWTNMLN